MCTHKHIMSLFSFLPLELINYVCTYLPSEDIKSTFTAETILASGVSLDLWKRKYKEKIEDLIHRIKHHESERI